MERRINYEYIVCDTMYLFFCQEYIDHIDKS